MRDSGAFPMRRWELLTRRHGSRLSFGLAKRRGHGYHCFCIRRRLHDVPRYQVRAISSGGERFLHTEEVTGSKPVSPTNRISGGWPCFGKPGPAIFFFRSNVTTRFYRLSTGMLPLLSRPDDLSVLDLFRRIRRGSRSTERRGPFRGDHRWSYPLGGDLLETSISTDA